jgi:hypothetical protein
MVSLRLCLALAVLACLAVLGQPAAAVSPNNKGRGTGEKKHGADRKDTHALMGVMWGVVLYCVVCS